MVSAKKEMSNSCISRNFRGCSQARSFPTTARRPSSGRTGQTSPEHTKMPANSARVWSRKTTSIGSFTCSPRLQRFPEHRSFRDRQPHIEAHEHQHGTRQERKPPAESEELFIGEPAREQQEDAAGKEEAERRAELREHAVPGALFGGAFSIASSTAPPHSPPRPSPWPKRHSASSSGAAKPMVR